MFKRLLILPIAVLSVLSASAQLRYSLKDTTTPYSPLTGAASMNGSLIWDEEIVHAPMPFTWTIDGTKTVNQFLLALEIPGVVADTNNFGSIDGFFLCDVDIADRGILSGAASLSPISYLTAGTSPNRIFKVEIANAGFFVEYGDHGTMDDSLSMQVWVYETSNIVEYHFGPSKITYPSEYFGFGGNGPVSGYGRSVNIVNLSSGNLYYMTGSPAAPTVDSMTLPLTAFPNGLSAWPADGKVYRFTPKSSSVGIPAASVSGGKLAVRVYPSIASSILNVQYTPDANQTAEYQISSITGAVMSNGKLHSGVQDIDVSTFASGSYYLQVKSGNASGNYHFVKQ